MKFDPHYIALLKNLRGVLLGVGAQEEEGALRWLVQHFRYRELGVPPSLWDRIPQKGKIRHIRFPFSEAEPLLEAFAASAKTTFFAAEAVATASAFACPVVVLSAEAFDYVAPFALYTFRADPPTTDRDRKFNLRLCDYAITDTYARTSEQAIKAIAGELEPSSLLRVRRTLAKEDATKRFWRLGDGTQGEPFVAYLDLLPLLRDRDPAYAELPIFAVVPALHLRVGDG